MGFFFLGGVGGGKMWESGESTGTPNNSYVLRSSGLSWKSGALFVRFSLKKERISFVFCCFENLSIAHNFGTTGPIQVGFSAKCTSPKIENYKCPIFNFRLISLDHMCSHPTHYLLSNQVDQACLKQLIYWK